MEGWGMSGAQYLYEDLTILCVHVLKVADNNCM